MNQAFEHPSISVRGVDDRQEVQEIALRKWEVRGRVHWPAASFRISQIFQNTGKKPLEILYTFPLSSDQLLEKFDVYLNEKHVTSKMVPAEEANEIYEKYVTRGDFALQLRSHRSNIFSLNLGNLAPGETVRVDFQLSQLLEIHQGRITLRVPTVVGPRYIPGIPQGPADGLGWAVPTDQVPDADYITPPFSFEDTSYSVSALFEITPALKIKAIESPSHPFQLKIDGQTYWAVMGDELKADRDIVLALEVEPDLPNHAWHTQYRERNILVFSLGGIETTPAPETPRDVIFLIDISGSMAGEKLATTVKAVKLCLRKLNPRDRFQLLAFESDVHPWVHDEDWQPVTNRMLQRADHWLNELMSMGGTELYPALENALRLPAQPGRRRVIVLLTDGEVGNEASLVNLIRKHQYRDYMVLFGIDTAVNQHLFQSIQNCTAAISEYIFPGEDISRAVNIQFQMLDKPWIRRIELPGNGKAVPFTDPFSQFPFPLDARSRTFLFLEADSAVNAMESLHIIFEDGSSQDVPVRYQKNDAFAQDVLLRFWARKLIEGFEAQRLEKTDDRASRFIEQLALELRIPSHYTRWIAVMEREQQLEEIADIQVVPVDFPYLWEEASFPMFVRSATSSADFHPSMLFQELELAPAKAITQEPDVFEILVFQNADGSFRLPKSPNSVYLDTLIVLYWLLQKVADGEANLIGYETNLEKALLFLHQHSANFTSLEQVLWHCLLVAFERHISLNAPNFPAAQEIQSISTPAKTIERVLPKLKKLFALRSLPEGKKLQKFADRLSGLLKKKGAI
ncbi:MAG: hypothetical protein Kow0042_23560 [Calditrichia bacterium]